MSTLDVFNQLCDALSAAAPVTGGPPRFGRAPIQRPSIAVRYYSKPRRNGISIGDNRSALNFNIFVLARNEPELMNLTDSVVAILDSFDDSILWSATRYEPVYGVEEEDYAFLFNIEV